MRPNPHRKVHTDQGEPRMPRIGRLPPETSETARDPSRPDTHHGMTQGRTLTTPGVLSSHWIPVRRRHGCRTTPVRALALICGLVTPRGSEGVEDPDAEEVEVRSAEHLAFQHLDLVDGSFHGAGAVRQGSSPRVRGAGRQVGHQLRRAGVIPVGAGSRGGGCGRGGRPWGRPCGCGGAERAPQHFQVDVEVIPTGAWPATTKPVRPAPRP